MFFFQQEMNEKLGGIIWRSDLDAGVKCLVQKLFMELSGDICMMVFYIFKGIGYGRAKRFHMPEEPQAWSGIRDLLSYGYVSPLMHEEKPDGELYVSSLYWLHNENCLNRISGRRHWKKRE